MSEKYFDVLTGVKKVEPVKLNIDKISKHNSVISAAKAFEAEGPIDFINELTNRVAREMDKFILKQFERHGYSEKEIVDLAIAGKIECVEHGTVITYIVNGLALFDIMRIGYDLSDEGDGYYNFTGRLICQDLIPAVMGERSDGVLNEGKREGK